MWFVKLHNRLQWVWAKSCTAEWRRNWFEKMNQKSQQFLTILEIFYEFKAKAKESNFPRHLYNNGSLNGLTTELKCINLLIPLSQACLTKCGHPFVCTVGLFRLVHKVIILLIVFWFLHLLFHLNTLLKMLFWSFYKVKSKQAWSRGLTYMKFFLMLALLRRTSFDPIYSHSAKRLSLITFRMGYQQQKPSILK